MARTVLLFGGTSTERRVSVASGQHVLKVLTQLEPWFITPQGAVVTVAAAELEAFERAFERDFVPAAPARWKTIGEAIASLPGDTALFLALHGGEGENGNLQALFEERGLAFTGSGSAASARAFDKVRAKELVAKAGLRTAESVVLAPGASADPVRALFARAGRIVLKPVADGSSIGLHHVRTAAELEAALSDVAAAKIAYLAETFVAGTELTVGVVEDDKGLRALPASEVRMEAGAAFDYAGKYLGKGSKELTPAEVPSAVSRAAQQLAIAAHKALGCEGYTRTDLIVDERGPVFLETNTLPGLTRASFIPQQLAVEGTPFVEFLEGQLQLAVARRDRAARARRSA
jgi:D-alanine-D-alanine ligase